METNNEEWSDVELCLDGVVDEIHSEKVVTNVVDTTREDLMEMVEEEKKDEVHDGEQKDKERGVSDSHEEVKVQTEEKQEEVKNNEEGIEEKHEKNKEEKMEMNDDVIEVSEEVTKSEVIVINDEPINVTDVDEEPQQRFTTTDFLNQQATSSTAPQSSDDKEVPQPMHEEPPMEVEVQHTEQPQKQEKPWNVWELHITPSTQEEIQQLTTKECLIQNKNDYLIEVFKEKDDTVPVFPNEIDNVEQIVSSQYAQREPVETAEGDDDDVVVTEEKVTRHILNKGTSTEDALSSKDIQPTRSEKEERKTPRRHAKPIVRETRRVRSVLSALKSDK